MPFCLDPLSTLGDYEVSDSLQVTSMLSESKHWIVVQLPIAYLATNWPIRVWFLPFFLFSISPVHFVIFDPTVQCNRCQWHKLFLWGMCVNSVSNQPTVKSSEPIRCKQTLFRTIHSKRISIRGMDCNESKPVLSPNKQHKDAGSAQYGNFINYYEFNSAEKRIDLLSNDIWKQHVKTTTTSLLYSISVAMREI